MSSKNIESRVLSCALLNKQSFMKCIQASIDRMIPPLIDLIYSYWETLLYLSTDDTWRDHSPTIRAHQFTSSPSFTSSFPDAFTVWYLLLPGSSTTNGPHESRLRLTGRMFMVHHGGCTIATDVIMTLTRDIDGLLSLLSDGDSQKVHHLTRASVFTRDNEEKELKTVTDTMPAFASYSDGEGVIATAIPFYNRNKNQLIDASNNLLDYAPFPCDLWFAYCRQKSERDRWKELISRSIEQQKEVVEVGCRVFIVAIFDHLRPNLTLRIVYFFSSSPSSSSDCFPTIEHLSAIRTCLKEKNLIK
jgi:hypothetical protein